MMRNTACTCCFFFNDTATTEIYTLSLHDALPIWKLTSQIGLQWDQSAQEKYVGANTFNMRNTRENGKYGGGKYLHPDRKSTRLNSSHANISYAVFCLKKNKK